MSAVPAEPVLTPRRARRSRFFIVAAMAALAVAALAWWQLTSGDDSEAAYETAAVSRADVRRTLSGTGSVEPAQTFVVRAARPGVVTAVSVAVGEQVGHAQELFRVNGEPVFALPGEIPFYRVLRPGDEGDDVRSLQMLLIELGYLDGEDDGEYGPETRSALRRFREDRGLSADAAPGPDTFQAVGRSPVVAEVRISVGSPTANDLAAVTLVPHGELEAVVQVNEIDIAQVEMGQEAFLSLDALPGQEVRATVIELPVALLHSGAGADSGVVTFPVRLRLEEAPTGVKAGMTVEADLVLETAENVLAVPVGGLQERQGREFVLVPGKGEDATPEALPVEVGLRSDDLVEVRSGLEEGDIIIIGLDVSQIDLPDSGIFTAPSPRSTDTPAETD